MANINDTIKLLREDVELRLTLERLDSSASRTKLQATFCRAEPAEKRAIVLALLRLEQLRLIDREFRITDTGYYFLDNLTTF
jgi:hypothetical protein